MSQKKLWLFLGPSASGKTTVEEFMILNHGFCRLVASTSRDIRDGEAPGVHYNYKSVSECLSEPVENAFEIIISKDWVYSMPKEELLAKFNDNTQDNYIYSIINLEPTRDLIDYIRLNFPKIDINVILFDIDVEQRVDLLRQRGESEQAISDRLAREDDLSEIDFGIDFKISNIYTSVEDFNTFFYNKST